jgi:glyoxylase-like metal-dependent hydrolase (beta-lactamase superfamily II)
MTSVSPIRIGTLTMPGRAVGTSSHAERLGVWSFLVRGPGITALVDVGLPPKMEVVDAYVRSQFGPDFGYDGANRDRLEEGLARYGVAQDAIDVIILTHLHHDHAGGLVWLPAAEVWCHAADRELVDGQYRPWLAPPWQVTGEMRARLESLEDSARLRWWSGRSEKIHKDLELRWVGGHSPGSSGVLVQTAEGVVGLLGDLLLTEDELIGARIPLLATDLRETVDGVRAMAADADVLWPGHARSGPVPANGARVAWGVTVRADVQPSSKASIGPQGDE